MLALKMELFNYQNFIDMIFMQNELNINYLEANMFRNAYIITMKNFSSLSSLYIQSLNIKYYYKWKT